MLFPALTEHLLLQVSAYLIAAQLSLRLQPVTPTAQCAIDPVAVEIIGEGDAHGDQTSTPTKGTVRCIGLPGGPSCRLCVIGDVPRGGRTEMVWTQSRLLLAMSLIAYVVSSGAITHLRLMPCHL